MSPFFPEFRNPSLLLLKETPSDKEVRKIVSLWKERLPSSPKLINKVLRVGLDKIENALEYTNPEDRRIAVNNGLFFLAALELYLFSPFCQHSPARTMEELINGLNKFCPGSPFLQIDSIFTDPLGNIFRIKKITLSEETPNNFQGRYTSGTNMWDSPQGKQFVPGHYWLEKLI